MFFENNFREFATINGVCEEIIKWPILLNQGKRIFKKELIGRIYTRDELSDTEFILVDDLPISDDLAS